MKLIALNRICPGKRHAWYKTDLGFDVRKPIGQKIGFNFNPRNVAPASDMDSYNVPKNKGWFRRLIDWIYGYFKRL